MEEAGEAPVGRPRRSQSGDHDGGREALLGRIAKLRADKESGATKAQAVDLFWPSIEENDARLFDDESGESPASGNTGASGLTQASSITEAGTRGTSHENFPGSSTSARKISPEPLSMSEELAAAGLIELPSDSKSHISIPDDDDDDDTVCSRPGFTSLVKQKTKVVRSISVSSSDTTDFGSANSTLDSNSAGARIGCDDEETLVGSSPSTLSNQWKESSKGMVLRWKDKKFILSAKLFSKLYVHQREGLRWLWGLHVFGIGGILGDDMGLGKTMQIAAFLSGLFSSQLIKRALIVAPKTLIPHWQKELAVVGLEEKVKDYSGSSLTAREANLRSVFKNGGILLTTYDIVRFNAKLLIRDQYGDDNDVSWDYLILDEGHLIKNPGTQRATSLKLIPTNHRIIISGTPIQNNLREMWALYNFCYPDLLGDRKEFKGKYEDRIFKGNDKHATDREKRIGSAAAKELRDCIAPYFLRRLKSEVFPTTSRPSSQQLAKKNDIIVWLRLSQRQREMYTAFLNSDAVEKSYQGSALAALTVLKKICDHPVLLTKRATADVMEGMESSLAGVDAAAAEKMRAFLFSFMDQDSEGIESHNEHSCKIVFLLALLENLVQEGHRTLIFAQTLKMLDIIQEEIKKRKYRFCRIDGKTKPADRKKIVEDFQINNKASIFLLTSQVGGLGLTLTGADRVVIVDPAWNPSKDNQSVDRAYRIGQNKDVIVYRLMTSGTLEEKIYRKQVFKGGLMKVATEKKEQFRYFSQQELRELLTVPRTGFDISPTQQQLYEEHAHQIEVDENLAKHIKFLEAQGIAGVSHHDLLFSKAAPDLPPAPKDEDARQGPALRMLKAVMMEDLRKKQAEGIPLAGVLAKVFDPKDKERLNRPEVKRRNLEREIDRLSSMLSDTILVSQLRDTGEKLRLRIKELQTELEAIPNDDVDLFSSDFGNLKL